MYNFATYRCGFAARKAAHDDPHITGLVWGEYTGGFLSQSVINV